LNCTDSAASAFFVSIILVMNMQTKVGANHKME